MQAQKPQHRPQTKPAATVGMSLRSGLRAGNATAEHFRHWGWQSA